MSDESVCLSLSFVGGWLTHILRLADSEGEEKHRFPGGEGGEEGLQSKISKNEQIHNMELSGRRWMDNM